MLVGQYSSKIGAKRRVAIPVKFRQDLGQKFIITRWYEGCLVLTSMANWDKLLNRATKRAELITKNVRETDRFLLGSAYEIEPDKQGRVVIPQTLVQYAMLTKTTKFVGLGDRVEVWDEKQWEKREKRILENAAELMEDIASSGDEQE